MCKWVVCVKECVGVAPPLPTSPTSPTYLHPMHSPQIRDVLERSKIAGFNRKLQLKPRKHEQVSVWTYVCIHVCVWLAECMPWRVGWGVGVVLVEASGRP